MPTNVDFDRLAEKVVGRDYAYLITVGDDGRPHPVPVMPELNGNTVRIGGLGGRRSRANLARSSDVTVLWPPPEPGGYTIIADGRADEVMLRWSEIEALRAEGLIEFHSHTHTHTRWDQTEPAGKNARMADELAQSRASLARRLGEASPHLCWPQGYFDADYVDIAQRAGFRYLYTTQAFGRNLPGADPLHIYRFAVRDTTGASVGRRIQVAAHPLIGPVFNRWKRWKRGLRL